MTARRVIVPYLLLESIGIVVWWIILLAVPSTRVDFRCREAPDATLLAFLLPDMVIMVGTGIAAAVSELRNLNMAYPLLCIHFGATAYAGLYCFLLPLLSNGDAWLAAVMMAPSVVCSGWLVIALRPRSRPC